MTSLVRPRTRRGTHTPQGQQTRKAILAAARRMCSEHWLDELSLAGLARIAGTTRASVLFQFPEGWLDIAAQLMMEELTAAHAAIEEIAVQRLKPADRLKRALYYFLKRGEELGTFMPNLRAYNFFWGDIIDAAVTPARDAALDSVARLIRQAAPGRQSAAASRDAAEILVFFTIDLTSAPMYRRLQPNERIAMLDTAIALVSSGLSTK